MKPIGSCCDTGQRAWFATCALLLAAGLCLPGSLFGRDEPKEKQIAAVEKEINELTGKLKELKDAPDTAKPLVSGGVPQEWLKSLTWRSIGPSNMGGRTIAISVFEQDPSLFWLATASGGLLKTENNGISFQHQFDHEATVSIGDVCVAPSDRNIVWVGTGEYSPRNSVSYGDGIYKSTDGGKTWKNMGLKKSYQISRVIVHPKNPDIVYVGALGRLWGPNEERGLFKTTDGGKTWKKILYFDDKTGVMEARMHPADPETLLVCMYERKRGIYDENDPIKKFGPHAGLYKTTDGGTNFNKLTKGLPTSEIGRIGLDFYRKNPNEVFMIMECADIGKGPAPKPEAYFGVFIPESEENEARVARVQDDSPSALAGIEPGDVLKTIDGKNVTPDSIRDINLAHKAGDKVKVKLEREGKEKEVELTYGEPQPPGAGRGGRGGGGGGGGARGGDRDRPYGAMYGGQRENQQDAQGSNGHIYGGVYKSMDAGENWTRINSIDPRPMYFSTIRVDPSDDKYLYVCGINIASSRDGGKTFRTGSRGGAGQRGSGVHDDQHALWVDPRDGRHILLSGDGGTYVTYDRMATWDHLNHMAIGQFYHVALDTRTFYNVYGGLQDNGSWGGPSRTRTSQGPVIQDWLSVGGGDGFTCRVDPNDPDQIYTTSQNGNMSRRNLRTGETAAIRPGGRGGRGGGGGGGGRAAGGGAAGAAAGGDAPPGGGGAARGGPGGGGAGGGGRGSGYRFNWSTPFILSSHNSHIFYCAGNVVFRSLDKGNDLQAISPDITLTSQGSATAIGESPRNPNVLFVGTDDGAVWVTKNGGKDWTNITKKFGLPGPRTVASIEPSRYKDERCYIAFDAHRMDDDKPYLYVTEDNGDTWKAITANLPWGSTRCLREDIKNENVLYAGTEFGAWASLDRGASWLRINNNLPTVAVHEFAQHPTTGEMVAATHGRSFWILDVSPLRQLTPEVAKAPATLFEPTPALRWRMEVAHGNTNRHFAGANPPNGASIFYALASKPKAITLEVQDAAGKNVRTLEPLSEPGIHRIIWDMGPAGGRGNRGGGGAAAAGGGRGAAGGAGGRAAGGGRANRGAGGQAGGAAGQAQPQPGAAGQTQPQPGGAGVAGGAAPGAQPNPAGGRAGGGGGFAGGFGGGRGGFGGGPPLPSGTYRVVLKVDGKEYVKLLQAIVESNAGGPSFFGDEDEDEDQDKDVDDVEP